MKKVISLFLLMFVLAMNVTYADVHPTNAALPTYKIILKNDVQVTPKIYTFEVWMTSTSTNVPLVLDNFQCGIKYNAAIVNGGTITASISYAGGALATLTDLQQPPTGAYIANPNCFRLAAKNGTSTLPITNGTLYKLLTVTLTNTVNFGQAPANLTWNFLTTPYPSKVFADVTGSGGASNSPLTLPTASATVPPNATIMSWHENGELINPILNAPTGPTVYNVTGGGAYCAGTTPTGMVTLSNSQTGYSYQLLKGGVAEGTPVVGTNAPLVWNNLAAGVYTVEATTTPATAMTGSATVTETALPATPVVSVVDNCDGTSTLTITNPEVGATFAWTGGLTGNPATANVVGIYNVTQTLGCTSLPSVDALATPKTTPAAPIVSVMDNCGNSDLSTTAAGSLLWSTTEVTPTINVTVAGPYTVTTTVNGCTSLPGTGIAAPIATPAAPIVTVVDNCGSSDLSTTAAGTLLWSNAMTTPTINVTTGGTYSVTTTVGGCTSAPSLLATAAPIAIPAAPIVTVVDNCGSSDLSTTAAGNLLWSNAMTTPTINVTVAGPYTVTTEVGGCISAASLVATAAPKAIPAAPGVTVVDACGQSVLTADNYTGTLLWSTNEVTPTITVTAANMYSVTQTVNGCVSAQGFGTAVPLAVPATPSISVQDNCGNTVLTASNYTGTLLWSNNEITPSITVLVGGTYTVTQTVNGCVSNAIGGFATPLAIPAAPVVTVVDNCGSSTLSTTAAGSLTWSTNEGTPSINVTAPGTYTVTTILNGCISPAGSGTAAPLAIPAAPSVSVQNNCGNSVLTVNSYTGALLWSTLETTPGITVTVAGPYTVTETINGCTSLPGTGVAAPMPIVNQTLAIVASANPSTQGNLVTYLATLTPNAGGGFEWFVNGVWNGSSSTYTFSYVPVNGDVVKCVVAASGCYTGAVSNLITMTVNPTPNVTNSWLGLTNAWHDPSNWSLNMVPIANHDVMISANVLNFPIISFPAICHNINLASAAQLIQNAPLTIGGNVTVQRILGAANWHMVSSPINDATAYAFSNANPNNFGQNLYMQYYNEAWVNSPGTPTPWMDVVNGPAEIMSYGKGYEAWSDLNHLITMEGTQLNSNSAPIALGYSAIASFPGYNLVGNPYPSAIDITGFPAWGTNMDASMYIWFGFNYIFSNGIIGDFTKVISGQAFMLKANAPGASFTIPQTAKSFGGLYYKSTVADVLKLKVTGNNYSDVAYINFNNNATNNFDSQFDVEKMYGINDAPQFYSTITNKNLSINTLPSLTSPVVVPMALTVGANTTYTITASEMNSFANGTTILLEDTKLNTFTNLMQQSAYTFTASPADNANRFRIHFGVNGINENGNGNINIYSDNNVIYVNNSGKETVKEIVVMNVLGQQILSKQAVNSTLNTITMDVASAYYVVKVITSNKVYTEKVYVR